MRRLIYGFVLGCILLGGVAHAHAATKLAVLSFSEHGKVSAGAGKTLAMLLSSSLDARRYYLVDSNRLRIVLKRHRWNAKRTLTTALLRDLSKMGVKLILTGAVSNHYKVFTVTYRAVSLKGRVLHSEALPPVQSWSALTSSLKYSVRMLLRRSKRGKVHKRSLRKSKKKRTKKRKKKKHKKKKSKLKAFKKTVKGMKRVKGLFPLWIKKNEFGNRTIYMEIAPKQLNKMFLISPTLEGGTGTYPLLTFAQMPEFPLHFKRNGKYIMAMQKNVRFRVNKKLPIARVMKRSFTDTVRATVPVLSQPHPKTKAILVDFKSLFMRQLARLTFWMRRGRRYYQRSMAMDARLSRIGRLTNLPRNLEMEFKAFFRRYGSSSVVPPGSKMRITLRYSISERPTTTYRPRLADDRVGHFLMVAKDYSNDRVDSRYIRYITRWNLEKKYPNKKISVPKKPIVFWLENAIPKRYRAAVRRGITVWNDAFEQAGFRNAIVAKQQPDNAKWDGADVRYNMIRWFLAHRAGFAQGPSRIDPITGQIYDADVRVDADMGAYLYRQFKMQVSPMRWLRGTGVHTLLYPFEHINSLQKLEASLKRLNRRPSFPKGHKPNNWRFCDHARGSMIQAALGWHLMKLRGVLPDPTLEKRFIDEFMVSLIAHEVGHTLGLRHNFKASTLHDHKHMHDKARTRKMGLTNSMMEYSPVNLAPPGKKQGEFWQTTLGPYDKWAIQYAYTPFPKAKTILAEKPYLDKIARRVADPKLAYATDEDAFGSASPFSVDPTTLRWDLGKEPLDYYKTRVQIANELWKRVEKQFGKKTSSYQKIRNVFSMAVGVYFRAGIQAAKYMGGLYHRRDHIGDPKGRLPFKPVPAAKQRAALHFLVKNYFSPGVFKWSPALLNKLAPNRMWDFEMSVWGQRVDFPVHRVVLMVQFMPLMRALHPAVLDRIQDIRLRLPKNADYLSIYELFSTVTGAIWAELTPQKSNATTRKVAAQPTKNAKSKKSTVASVGPARAVTKKATPIRIDSLRRNLQWYHLQWMIAYNFATFLSTTDATSAARAQLLSIQKNIKKGLKRAADTETRAHLQKCLLRIQTVLKPSLVRLR